MNGKKVVIYEPNRARSESECVDERHIPSRQILLRNEYTLVSAGTELACLAGVEYWFPIPGTPGYCGVGEVIGVGDGVEGFQIGDFVYSDTGHREFAVLPAHDPSTLVAKVALPVDHRFVPYLRMASIAFTSTIVSNIQLGDKVLVNGLGVVGNFAAQLAQLQGAQVLCAEPDAARRAIAVRCGIKNVVDSASATFEDELSRFAGAEGFSTAIDSTGSTSVILSALPRIARNGDDTSGNSQRRFRRRYDRGFAQDSSGGYESVDSRSARGS